LGPIELDFHSKYYEQDNSENEEIEYQFCDLVPILYGDDTSDEDRSLISLHHGDCFKTNSKIKRSCKKSCNDIVSGQNQDKYLMNCVGNFIETSYESDDLSCSNIHRNPYLVPTLNDKGMSQKLDPFYYYNKKNQQYFTCTPNITDLLTKLSTQEQKMTQNDISNAFGMTSRICKLPKCMGKFTETPSSSDSCRNNYYISDGTYYNIKYDETTSKCTSGKIICLPAEKFPTCNEYKIDFPPN